jgi:hypothetical protein
MRIMNRFSTLALLLALLPGSLPSASAVTFNLQLHLESSCREQFNFQYGPMSHQQILTLFTDLITLSEEEAQLVELQEIGLERMLRETENQPRVPGKLPPEPAEIKGNRLFHGHWESYEQLLAQANAIPDGVIIAKDSEKSLWVATPEQFAASPGLLTLSFHGSGSEAVSLKAQLYAIKNRKSVRDKLQRLLLGEQVGIESTFQAQYTHQLVNKWRTFASNLQNQYEAELVALQTPTVHEAGLKLPDDLAMKFSPQDRNTIQGMLKEGSQPGRAFWAKHESVYARDQDFNNRRFVEILTQEMSRPGYNGDVLDRIGIQVVDYESLIANARAKKDVFTSVIRELDEMLRVLNLTEQFLPPGRG